MKSIRSKESILLVVVLIFALNFIYFKYIYKGYEAKRNDIINRINICNEKTTKAISYFNENLGILKKIVSIKHKILISKRNMELLENNRTTTFDMSNILKTLLVKSGVSVYSLSLSGINKMKSKKTYSFSVQINDSLDKILKFMDLIESYSDNMYIPSYKIKPKNGSYNVTMTVNFDYVSAK